MSARSTLLLLSLPLLAACGGSGFSGWAGTVVDSAGTTVVHNPDKGTWAPDQAWTVKEVLSIGETAGDAEYQFGQVAGIDIDASGNLYVADLQGQDVRVYDPTGKYLRTIGGPGSGPGEFGRQITGMEVMGGELWVLDLGNQRLSRMSLEGKPLGDTHVDFAQAIPARLDEMPAGRLVAQLRHLAFTGPDAAPTGDAVVAVNADGTFGDTVAMLPPGESLTISGGRAQPKIFGSEPSWDAAESGKMVFGETRRYLLEVRDTSGALQRIITRPDAPKPVTDRDKQVILDFIRKTVKDQGTPISATALENYLKSIQFADNYPAFAVVAFGPQGSIWAQQVLSGSDLAGSTEGTFDPQELGSTSWDVFSAEGKYMGVVTFPGKYRPIRVVGDRFYGVARDELDVQRVKVYQVVMP